MAIDYDEILMQLYVARRLDTRKTSPAEDYQRAREDADGFMAEHKAHGSRERIEAAQK